jgi:hypothetical protein
MENEMAVVGDERFPLTANAVVARVRLIQEVMQKVMKKDTHYGVIPGCAKPSLWKPGAEQLLVTFRIAPDEPKVEDLSTGDSIRYRVTRTGTGQRSDPWPLASVSAPPMRKNTSGGRPVCDAEFEAAPEDRKRLKYKRDGGTEKQIRTNPADVANTILKMADKRAFVAMTLLATAAVGYLHPGPRGPSPEVAESIEGRAERSEPIPGARGQAGRRQDQRPAAQAVLRHLQGGGEI